MAVAAPPAVPPPPAPPATATEVLARGRGPFEACYVDDERVVAQAGAFYGGWVTHDIVGPFKGAPGPWGW